MRRLLLATALSGLAVLAHAPAAGALPPIKHVFVLMLENEGAATTFGAKSPAPYLAHDLRARGAFVPNYYGIGHASLDNYIALVSGQGPNPYTQADAPAYADFVGTGPGPNGQWIGQGSIYPAGVRTIADQLDDAGLTWRGYMEDMGKDPTREPATCGHPAPNTPDGTQTATAKDQYAARHNPFVYFHSIVDDQARCDANDVPLSRLQGDLESAGTTPNYVFITPNLCHDGHDAPCADGEPGGLKSADLFLRRWVPRITSSPAYADGGVLIVTFDEAEQSDPSSCCGEQQGPNTPNNAGAKSMGAGGGRTGAVILSRYVNPGTRTKQSYNHYSLLRSVEDWFGLGHLGYAAVGGLRPFGTDVFTNLAGKPKPPIAPPTVRVAKLPSRCVSRAFRAHVQSTGRNVTTVVRRDRRVIRRFGRGDVFLRIHPRRLRAGRHTISATATDRFGRRARASRRFVVCSRA